MYEIIVRKYIPSDEAALADYFARDDNTHYVKDTAHCDKFTVAEYNGVVAGYLYASIKAGNCHTFIYVSPEYRRLGVGTALCYEAERLCREIGEDEIWGYYYDNETMMFTDKLGFQFTTTHLNLEYTDDIIPEPEIVRDIRKCREEDFERCQYLWNTGMHEMRVRVGYPDSKIYEPTEEDKEGFIKDLDNNFALEKDGRIVGYGIIAGDKIGALAVDMSMYNKGYGTALAIFMTNEILKRGYKTAYSGCEGKNINSRRVHEKIGYKVTKTAYNSFKRIE